MKDVKIEMSEAQTQNWEKKEREKGERGQNSITCIKISQFLE